MQNNQKIPEGWSVKKLGDICHINKSSLSEKTSKDYKFKYIDLSSVDEGKIEFPTDDISFGEAPSRARRKINKNDIIMSTVRPNLKGFAFIDFDSTDFICSTGFAVLTAKEHAYNRYIYQLLYSKNIETQINNMLVGSNYPAINSSDVASLKIALPPLPEQEKIAGILGTWDEAIEKLVRLIEQKKLLKKGLMQKLIYTRTNATKYKVADLFELGRGRVISKNEIDTHQGVFPVYSSQTSDNGILGYINTYDFQGEYITWTTDGANAGEVFYRNGKFNCTNVCGTAKAKEKNVNLYYAMSFLNHVSKKYVSYVGNPKLMNGVFAIIPLILPDIEIQNKVAAILSTADDEINLLNQKLKATKEQKKGLMQQLLTGQIRVKGN